MNKTQLLQPQEEPIDLLSELLDTSDITEDLPRIPDILVFGRMW